MTKRAQKGYKTHAVSFRMPEDVYNELAAVAEMRGVDLSGMLNWIVAEYRPTLLRKKAEYETNMLESAAQSLSLNIQTSGDTAKGLVLIRDLLKTLQNVYAELAKRAIDEEAERAA